MRMGGRLGGLFWRFWTAATAANMADGIRVGAFPLLAVALTADPLGVALVAAAQQAAVLLVGLPAGAVADRLRPARVLVAADLIRVVVLAGLLTAVATGTASIPMLAGSAFMFGVAETFRDTAAPIMLPRLVERSQLERANGRLVSSEVVGNEFAGPLLGAALFGITAILALAANGAALALAAVLVLSLPRAVTGARAGANGDGTPDAPEYQPAKGLLGGARWLIGQRLLRTVAIAGAVLTFADAAWWAVLVLYSKDALGLTDAWYGLLLAAGAVGGTVGALIVDRLAARFAPVPLLLAGTLAAGLPAGVLAIWRNVLLSAVALAVSSAGFALWNVVALSLRQRLVPEFLLGRVMAVYRIAFFGAAMLGSVAGGLLTATTSLAAPFTLSVVLATASASLLVTARSPGPDPS